MWTGELTSEDLLVDADAGEVALIVIGVVLPVLGVARLVLAHARDLLQDRSPVSRLGVVRARSQQCESGNTRRDQDLTSTTWQSIQKASTSSMNSRKMPTMKLRDWLQRDSQCSQPSDGCITRSGV